MWTRRSRWSCLFAEPYLSNFSDSFASSLIGTPNSVAIIFTVSQRG